ncbi:tetraketide alpha-pyrone reductase 1 [Typha angustifolia]|uniref:tetraketide alpha-pyrone reductase 1 n=1 Tax=Typha angustifolia TaxID=59011 RepID=UPI003C2D39B0
MEKVSGNKGKVCVTGAGGYVASWLIKRLLEAGYHVTGTVRDPGDQKKLAHLWQLDGARERLSLVKADLMEEGSFDDAVMGCEGVFHTASPIVELKSDPKTEMVDPAVQGTLNVLRSCKKNPHLRRIVLTSSSSTTRVREDIDPNVPLDETSWSSAELCERLKLWYPLAKLLAEKAAWEFAKENDIDLVTVIPTYVVGPSLPRNLSVTAATILSLLRGETDFSSYGRMGYVHIDDVARCHILVYENANAEGRYICSSAVLEYNELGELLRERYPSLPIAKSFGSKHGGQSYEFNTSKLQDLGFKFKGIGEIFDDCVQSLKKQGHLS